jgi:uncharacterized protein YceK
MYNVFLTLFLLISISGCSTINSLSPGSGGSIFEIRNKSYTDIWKAINRTASRSLTIVQSDKEKGELRAEKAATLFTWGEVVGVFVSPPYNGANVYTVEIQSLKRMKPQLTGQDWTVTMKAGILAELDE